MKWKVSCIQMTIAFGQPEANYAKAEEMIRLAAAANACERGNGNSSLDRETGESCASLFLLPELWTTGYDLPRLSVIADPEGDQTIAFLSSLARTYQTTVIGGSYARLTANGIYNSMPFIDRDGRLLGHYDKLHLFGLMNEPSYLKPGSHKGLFQLDGIVSAGVICYDIRFPEWIRAHVLAGAEVLFVAAEWPDVRLEHWRALLIARAIENQCYVIACNRAGIDPDNRFAGHSLIIDPWGEVIAEAGLDEEVLTAIIDLNRVKEARSRIPVFKDRRPDCYTKS
ncbi:carbon-nitrogen family hydrolase [Gorillibacterium timonense]|uniref:carbon-nitrogen family hydrolase n=1 Tax=Gorillibacterium timonense TaxID=1689269 RepID=UPI00071CD1C9|nr:carbon-nitrogen family hydrolase [Gorillibacterium timonense]